MSKHFLYGKHPILECRRAARRKIKTLYFHRNNQDQELQELFKKLKTSSVPLIETTRDELDEKVMGAKHQGLVAEVEGFPYVSANEILQNLGKKEQAACLVLDQIQDPQNLGSILRSAYAFGIEHVLIMKDRACEMTAAVTKASAGASEHMKVAKINNLVHSMKDFQEKGFWSVGLDMKGEKSVHDFEFPQKSLIILGSEGFGLRRLTQESCDFLLRIPQKSQLNSLNASVAASLVIYEWAK